MDSPGPGRHRAAAPGSTSRVTLRRTLALAWPGWGDAAGYIALAVVLAWVAVLAGLL